MQKILFIDNAHSLLESGLVQLGFSCDDGTKLNRDEVKTVIENYVGVIIRSRITLDEEVLSHAISLRFIARCGAGMENIDIDYAERKGICCINAPEGNRDAVAEHALGMLLALFNNLGKADNEIRYGKWNRENNRGVELHGKTVGIIGYGNMGSAFAQRLTGFGCNITAFDKYKKNYGTKQIKESGLQELFEETDVLSIHLPLTEETAFMINDDFISRFKKNLYIINTARGPIVNTADLVKNLETGKVKGACLDVLEYEDSSFEKFSTSLQAAVNDLQNFGTNIPAPLRYLVHSPKVILTPHIAGWTFESYKKIASVILDKIKIFLETAV